MKFRPLLIAAIALAVGSALWYVWQPSSADRIVLPTVPVAPPRESKAGSAPAAASPAATVAMTPAAPGTAPRVVSQTPRPGPTPPIVAPAPPPMKVVYMPPEAKEPAEMGQLRATAQLVKDYRQMMGENPVGNNADIMKCLMGGNKKGAMMGPPPGMSLNGDGELLDSWGRPIFFHAESKDEMEIRSAGPDGRLWTGDDLVTK